LKPAYHLDMLQTTLRVIHSHTEIKSFGPQKHIYMPRETNQDAFPRTGTDSPTLVRGLCGVTLQSENMMKSTWRKKAARQPAN
jgi:hypothetical protein